MLKTRASNQIPAWESEKQFDFKSRLESGLTLTEVFRVLRVRRRLIIGTIATILILTVAILLQFTPIYSATAVVMLNQQKNNIEDVNSVLAGLPTDQTSIQNQIEILTSRGLASRVIDKLRLDRDPEFNEDLKFNLIALLSYLNPSRWLGEPASNLSKAEQNAARRDGLVDKFLKRLTVDQVGLSTALEVTFASEEAGKAQRITNAIADAYVEDQLNAKFEATQKATKWLAERIANLAGQVQAADAAVQEYKAANNLSNSTDGTSVVDQQLSTLNGQVIAARADLAQKQAMYSHVATLQRSGRAADVSQVVESPLISQLRGQETDLIRQEAQLKSRYGPNHPKMLDLESQKANLKTKIDEEVGHVVQTVANDAAVSAAQVRSLESSFAQLEATSLIQSKAGIKLKALESRATSARSMYEAFLSRLKETQGQEGIATPDARVLSWAALPLSPSFPNKLLAIAAAIPISLILGLLLAFLVERLDSGFRTISQIEEVLGLPVLATIPELAMPKDSASSRVVEKPMSAFTEAVRGLQLGITLSNVDHNPKTIVVTSALPGEGKTTVAISMARLAAKGGKRVLIMDCDLRNPRIAESMGLTKPVLGILEVLAGTAQIETCLIKDPITSALILPCAQKPSNPMDLLASAAMKQLLAKLDGVFDLIIMDSAPVLAVHDTKMLGQIADAFLFVVRWEKTPRDAAIGAIRSLIDVKAQIVGVALSRANADRFQTYNYGNYGYKGYNQYYTE